MRLTVFEHIAYHRGICPCSDGPLSLIRADRCNDTDVLIKNGNINACLFLYGIYNGKIIVQQMLPFQEVDDAVLFHRMIIALIHGIIPGGNRMAQIYKAVFCLHI